MHQHRPALYRSLRASGELESTALRLNEFAKACHMDLIKRLSYGRYSSTDIELRADLEVMQRFIRLSPGQTDVALSGIVPEASHQ